MMVGPEIGLVFGSVLVLTSILRQLADGAEQQSTGEEASYMITGIWYLVSGMVDFAAVIILYYTPRGCIA